MAGSRVGGSVLTGSGENIGNGTVFSDCGSSARDAYEADVSIERDLAREGDARGEPADAFHAGWTGCGVGVGVESDCEASSTFEMGPCSVEGLLFGLPEVLSEESSSPTLNLGRLLRAAGGVTTEMERGTDASGAAEPVRSMETGRDADLTRRGRPRRGL